MAIAEPTTTAAICFVSHLYDASRVGKTLRNRDRLLAYRFRGRSPHRSRVNQRRRRLNRLK
jgi:hypothetical protein